MVDDTALGLAGIAAASTALVHEWLHSSSVTQDLPSLDLLNQGAGIGSVSVGLVIFVALGVLINYYVYEMD